jgi:predicted phage baseplate assembly protein
LSAACDAKITFDDPVIGSVQMTVDQRVVNITSPEDGGALTYTLYKVVNGLVNVANSNGSIRLNEGEADDADKKVFTNLVLQEGALVSETGSFAATEGVKSIKLNQGPVVEGSVAVYVSSPTTGQTGAYREVPNLYFASGVSDKIFEVVYDDNYNATVLFGDGSVGISPEDTASFRVEYRVGGGTRGNIQKDLINASITATSRKGTITNISKGTGGANAETIEHAKKYAPLNFRRQDRLVTLEDYSVFANTFISNFGTVGKATAATRKAYASANVIDIYVLEKASDLQLQRATTNFKTQLLAGINEKRMATDDIAIVDGLIRTLDLDVTIRIDKEDEENQDQIKAKVRDKILTYMNADNRDFGDDLNIAELNRQIFEVDEVRYSTVDSLDQDITIDFNEIIQLNNLTISVILLD